MTINEAIHELRLIAEYALSDISEGVLLRRPERIEEALHMAIQALEKE